MIHVDEIIMFVLGLGILAVSLINYSTLKKIDSFKTLVMTFYLLLTAWALTVFEALFAHNLLNYLEHFCYALSSIFLLAWFWKVFGKAKGGH